MIRSLKTVMLVIPAVVVALAACSSADKGQPSAQEPTKPQDSVASLVAKTMSEPTEITIYYFWQRTYEDFMEVYGNDIVKKYPNLKIKWIQNTEGSKPQDIIATRTNVDLYYSTAGNLRQMVDLGIDPDISDLVTKYKYDTSPIEPVVVDFLKNVNKGSGFAGVPFVNQTLALFYNKDIFDKFGVPYLKDGMTWDEVFEKAKLLTRQEGGVLYRGYGENWFPNQIVLNQLSLPLIDPVKMTAAFDNDKWRSFFNTFLRFYQLPDYKPDSKILTGASPREAFTKEQTFAINPRNNGDFPRKSLGHTLNWDVVTYPAMDATKAGPQPQPVFFVIPKSAKNRDAAFLAATALLEKEIQMKGSRNGLHPILKDSAVREVFGTNVPDLAGKNTKALLPEKYASIIEQNVFNDNAADNLSKAFQSIVLGEKDMNTAFRDAAEAVNKNINSKLGR